MVDHKGLGPSLVARMEERFLAPFKGNAFATRTWFLVVVSFVMALHAALLGYFLYRDSRDPVRSVQVAETPVEIIIEKPKPPPAKAPEPPKQRAKPEIEKPAFSAPRAPSETRVEAQALDKETHAPKAATPPKDGQPAPSREDFSVATDPADPGKTDETAVKKDVLDKDAEALEEAKPRPAKKPETKIAKSQPITKTHRTRIAPRQFAGVSALPDFKFARPTKKAPITGGTEDERYLSNVFARIMSNYHAAALGPEDDLGTVTVAFDVDDDGSVISMQVVQSSGDRDVDDAAVAAVWRASPMPPLPNGAPHGLVARISADAAPIMATGRRGR